MSRWEICNAAAECRHPTFVLAVLAFADDDRPRKAKMDDVTAASLALCTQSINLLPTASILTMTNGHFCLICMYSLTDSSERSDARTLQSTARLERMSG